MNQETIIPTGNPKFSLEEMITQKMRNLKNVDKVKYKRYVDKEVSEISNLWGIHDELEFFKEFDLLTIIQNAINKEGERGNDKLIITIPITDKLNSNRIAQLNLAERRYKNVL